MTFWKDSRDIINKMLKNQQIDNSLAHGIACSFSNDRLNYLSTDILYKTIITCYAEHRPLVLSPDMIWLLIVQIIAKHINDHAEEYRGKLVNFEGKKDLEVESQTDLFDPKTNWALLLEQMCDKIVANTQGDLASTSVCDFSTTGENENFVVGCELANFVSLTANMKSYLELAHLYVHAAHTEKGRRNRYCGKSGIDQLHKLEYELQHKPYTRNSELDELYLILFPQRNSNVIHK